MSADIIKQLEERYPGKKAYDLSGQGLHFVCELEPTSEHPEYDRCVEVIIKSEPHRHDRTTQRYTVLSGTLLLHVDSDSLTLSKGDTHTVEPGIRHWAESDNEAWVEIYSTPGWTKADHLL